MIDPAIALALRAAFALLLGSAALHKLRDPERFRSVLAAYEILPRSTLAVAAPLFGGFEALLAAALAIGVALPPAGAATSALLLVYGAAISINVRRGRTDIDCGCMGPASRVPLGYGLVLRNLALAGAAALLVLPASSRALAWLDAVSVALATAALAASWLAAERLLALAPRAAMLRRSAS